jgi:hypothetical protein
MVILGETCIEVQRDRKLERDRERQIQKDRQTE